MFPFSFSFFIPQLFDAGILFSLVLRVQRAGDKYSR